MRVAWELCANGCAADGLRPDSAVVSTDTDPRFIAELLRNTRNQGESTVTKCDKVHMQRFKMLLLLSEK